MRKFILFLILFVTCFRCFAQDVIQFKTIDSKLLQPLSYTEYIGSPYFLEKDLYRGGSVKVTPNEVYKDEMKLLYNQFTDEVTFKYSDTEPLAFKTRPLAFTINSVTADGDITELKFRLGVVTTKDPTGRDYYQILHGENIQLLKRVKKKVYETKGYGESIVKKTFIEEISYYLLENENNLISVKSYKDFANLNNEISKYIADYKLTHNTESNFISLTKFYQSLK